ncbi:unnamed protein product, partial [marine sediment metagenome]
DAQVSLSVTWIPAVFIEQGQNCNYYQQVFLLHIFSYLE